MPYIVGVLHTGSDSDHVHNHILLDCSKSLSFYVDISSSTFARCWN